MTISVHMFKKHLWSRTKLVRISGFCITNRPLRAVLRISYLDLVFFNKKKSNKSKSLGSFALQFVVSSRDSSGGCQSEPLGSFLLLDVNFGGGDDAESCLPLQQFLIHHLVEISRYHFKIIDASAFGCRHNADCVVFSFQ